MKIAVTGTSNSVMTHGWVNQMRKLPEVAGHEIVNMSIGAAPVHAAAYSIAANCVARDYDICFIESAINDQQMLHIGRLNYGVWAATFAGVLANFSAPDARCLPIVLIFPQRDLIRAKSHIETISGWTAALCEKFGVPYVDVYESLRQEAVVAPEALFKDWTHFVPAAAEAIAREMSAVVERAGSLPHGLSGRSEGRTPFFHALPATKLDGRNVQVERRSTSALGFDVAALSAGSRMMLKNVGYLAGILHWADAGSGVVNLKTKQRHVSKLMRKEWNNLFVMTHLGIPVRATPDIEVTTGMSSSAVNEYAFGQKPWMPIEGDNANIVGFLTSEIDLMTFGRQLIKNNASKTKLPLDKRRFVVETRLAARFAEAQYKSESAIA